jgi:hypothetical protein
MTLTNSAASLKVLLKNALETEYYSHPIPSEMDENLSEVIGGYLSLDNETFESIVSGIEGDNARVLGLYAERMASLAVRQHSAAPIRNGLIALIIYSRTQDSRDVMLILSLLHDASIKVAGDANEIFHEISSLVCGEKLLNNFLARSDEDKSIKAMGYEESCNEDGFLYMRTW